ncbi:ferritin-like domain-containing protein [Epilithonimonas sp. JDS]|uniref:YciE/YciF ferroxidase family protein n=1 Tax=Epilithonimonas sp. JDS TaxID=2902797 RepID=UPI001E4D98F8|nr:ferritin-like domain-containing protein [Epilithonimonas sp. JDS]MCD9853071.1 ferritin-like domain-containing protein [Epilithonimonas sp. JDS]
MATKATTTKKSTAAKSTPAKSTSKSAASKSTPAKSAAPKSSPAKAADAKKIPAKKDAAKELKDLFEDSLKDIYWAEKALTKALPKMHKNATDVKLKQAISDHLAQTKNQVKRLEDCFAALGKKAEAKKCDAMQGLLDEGESIIEETKPGAVRDAGIIAASQKVEHYEIATYGTLAAFAKVLKEKKCLKYLLETLEEEKQCDELLSSIADTNLNSKAL